MNKFVGVTGAAAVAIGTAAVGVMAATGAESATQPSQQAVRTAVAATPSAENSVWTEPDHYRFDLNRLPCVIPSNVRLLGPAWSVEVLHHRVARVKVILEVPGHTVSTTEVPTMGELMATAGTARHAGSPHVLLNWKDGGPLAVPVEVTGTDPDCYYVQSYRVL